MNLWTHWSCCGGFEVLPSLCPRRCPSAISTLCPQGWCGDCDMMKVSIRATARHYYTFIQTANSPPAEHTLVSTGQTGSCLHTAMALNAVESVFIAAASSSQHWLQVVWVCYYHIGMSYNSYSSITFYLSPPAELHTWMWSNYFIALLL